MATLTLIAEPFPDWEAEAQRAAGRDLAQAIVDTAPRSCSGRYLLAKGSPAPEFDSPLMRVDHLPFRSGLLPLIWQNGASARTFDGEFVHAPTPLAPLRARGDDDGSQTSVTITHDLAWEAPELLGGSGARMYRSYTRRAVKLADVVLTSTHATARVVQRHYGADLPIQVLQLAPPREYLRPADAAERRTALGLPERYALTTAPLGALGRLEWILDAMRADPDLPPLVVLEGLDPEGAERREPTALAIPVELQNRVVAVRARELADVGAALAGATVFLQPQGYCGAGFTVLGALAAGVPVVHSDHPAVAEIVFDAGIGCDSSDSFGAGYRGLIHDPQALTCLSVLAGDRSRGFSWRGAAWQLWEMHANL